MKRRTKISESAGCARAALSHAPDARHSRNSHDQHESHPARHHGLTPLALLTAAFAVIALMLATGSPSQGVETTANIQPKRDVVIDQLILAAAEKASVTPADLCSDDVFIRRASLDIIGRIPTADEYRQFMTDPEHQRRENLVQRLVSDPRFEHRWTTFYGDMLQVNSNAVGGGAFSRFVRDSVKQRMPYNVMAGRMLTAIGSYHQEPASGFVISTGGDPLEVVGRISQNMLGVRMQCAQCHDHPYDIWTQRDYYKLAAFFGHTAVMNAGNNNDPTHVYERKESQVRWPPSPLPGQETRPMAANWPLDPNATSVVAANDWRNWGPKRDKLADDMNDLLAISSSKDSAETMMLDDERKNLAKNHKWRPISKERESFAAIITSPGNRYFSHNIVNRVWASLMGKGIVEPLDDFRPDNPPSHPQLLNHLARSFVEDGYDLPRLVQRIVLSDAYQRARLTESSDDQRKLAESMFVAAPLRRVEAEAIYDSIITAGHLWNRKHAVGANIKERELRVRIEIVDKEQMAMDPRAAPPEAVVVAISDGYGPERDADVANLLANVDDPLMNLRILHAGKDDMTPMNMRQGNDRPREREGVDYRYEVRIEKYDDNPTFSSAYTMAAPAPQEHFLRQFGQPARELLGETRDNTPNMRQALMLMNGRLVHEASRLGQLEPLSRLIRDEKRPENLVDQIYLEVLTRKPTAEEKSIALQIFDNADSLESAIADLRWALFNSHTFRYYP